MADPSTVDFQPTPRYRRYVLFVLTGVYAFNFIDRQILVILAEPIKADLDLSDTQLGLLTGLAFAFFYVMLGIPIARYADKANRKNIVAVALTVWSGMTALSGLAQNFTQLLLARIGVGVGEAGGSPPAHAIISDYYPPKQRATALSIYSMGVYIGVFLGFLVGGIIGKVFGWRVALYALGIPGILYAVLLYYTVKEPPRGLTDKVKDMQQTSFANVIRILFSKKTFVLAAFATGAQTFTNYGVGNFTPSFLNRIHGMDLASISILLALCAGLGGGLGTFLGGYIADKMRMRDIRWYLWVSILGAGLNIIPATIFYFSGNLTLVLIAIFLSNILTALYLGPSIAVSHSLVSAKMRALASAMLFLILNMIGLGLGPVVIGLLSDYLEPAYGIESLRYAFTISYLTSAITMLLFYLASRTYKQELADFTEDEEKESKDILEHLVPEK
jgi:predicted MFS family arabinose efflux permease